MSDTKEIKVGKCLKFVPLENRDQVVPLEKTEFYKHYEHILSKKEIPSQSLDCIILDYLLGMDRDSTGCTVDKARKENYEIFKKIYELYPNAITVARNNRDKDYLDDLSNYGVAGV